MSSGKLFGEEAALILPERAQNRRTPKAEVTGDYDRAAVRTRRSVAVVGTRAAAEHRDSRGVRHLPGPLTR